MLFSTYIDKVRNGVFDTTIDDSENPWNGLSPYADPEKSVDKKPKLFCGRDNETYKLSQQIKNQILVTVYGKSGNGKTSLLNAGVCPRLRQEQFVPISIRLGDILDKSINFQQYIITEIEKQSSMRREVIDVVPKYGEDKKDEIDYLWNYFARHRFFKGEQMVFPVIILDQFEEVFRERQEDAAILLKQIYYMMDENHALSDCNVDGELYEYYFNFRFVIAIREDDLFKLEDTIDSNYLSLMKENRFRLRSISEKGAREVILKPGKDIFYEADKEDIVKTVISIAKEQDGTIGSNVLSLLCNRIYVRKLKDRINEPLTHEYVKDIVSANPLDQFYSEATKDLTRKERAYLEDNFVDVAGRRCSVSKENLQKKIRSWEKLLGGANKILQESDNGRIELIHETFCPILEERKMQRDEKWRSLCENLLIGISLIVVFFATCYFPSSNSFSIDSLVHMVIFLMNRVNVVMVIILGVGVVREVLDAKHCIISGLCSTIPVLLFIFLGKIDEPSTIYFIVANCLLFVYAIVSFIIVKNSHQQSYMSFMEYLNLRQVCVWGAIVIGFIMVHIQFNYNIGNVFWLMYLFFYCCLRGFALLPINAMFLLYVVIVLPMSIVYTTSDILIFSLYDITPIICVLIIPVYVCVSIFVDPKMDVKTKFSMLFVCIAYLCVLFVLYLLTYKYKFLLLLFWPIIGLILVYKAYKHEIKHPIINYLITLVVIIVFCVYALGYNPQIKGINPEIQIGSWRWSAVIKENDGHIEVLNAWTGKKIIETDFDGVDDDKWLYAKTKYSFESKYGFRIYHSDSVMSYCFFPDFEYEINRKRMNNDLVAMTFCSYRDAIFKHLVSGEPISSQQYPKCIVQLLEYETEQIMNLLNTDFDRSDNLEYKERQAQLFQLLCRSLSVSLLKSVSNDVSGNIDMKLLFDAFERFVNSHWELMTNEKLANGGLDYITCFEKIADMYWVSVKDSCISRILEPLQHEFKTIDNDFSYQINLEKKIERLRLINSPLQLEDVLVDD